jgi:hypothetical protein
LPCAAGFFHAAKEFETEISRLKLLLAEKNDTNNYTVPPGVIRNHTPVSPARTPESNSRLSSANAIVQHGTFRDEAREASFSQYCRCMQG